jgi:hypothetical protein
MILAPKAPAAAVIRQVVQTGSVNFIISPQLPTFRVAESLGLKGDLRQRQELLRIGA